MRLAIATTHSRSYLCRAPAAKSVPQLPGSMYPTLTSNAGPTYARQLRQNSVGLSGTATLLWMPSSETGAVGRLTALGAGADSYGPSGGVSLICLRMGLDCRTNRNCFLRLNLWREIRSPVGIRVQAAAVWLSGFLTNQNLDR